MPKVVIIGGGPAGCAAAAAAAKIGASVTLLERMDELGGFGLCAGRSHVKGLADKEELKLMGCDDIFEVMNEKCVLHRYCEFPQQPGPFSNPTPKELTATGAILYDVGKLGPELKKHLQSLGVEVRLETRAVDVQKTNSKINCLVLKKWDGPKLQGDVFVDATGSAGPEENCRKYGYGCVICIMRCTSFSGRVSMAERAGAEETMKKRPNGVIGFLNSDYGLLKETLSPEIREELERKGVKIVPVPKEQHKNFYERTYEATGNRDYVDFFTENLVLADIGPYAKVIQGQWAPLADLRKIPGLEQVRLADPYASGIGNAVRFLAICPRDETLKVPGVDNLYVCGEKLGVNGLTAAILGGVIAGHNAARQSLGATPLVLPDDTILGAHVAQLTRTWDVSAEWKVRGETYHGVKLPDKVKAEVRSRVEKHGLLNILAKKP